MTSDPVPEPTAPATDGPSRPPESSAPLRWPEWFRAFDLALVVMAVVLAFLVSSFVSRNADLWRHLASGRLLAKFSYPMGGDPFTYTAAERVWVNSNWLTEVLFYALYSIDPTGAVLVAVKAMAFAGTLAVLLLLRRPQFSFWPWTVAITLAAIGMALQAQLKPIVFGWLLHAVFLVTLFRADWTCGGKWRVPLILGGLTVVWANTDTFAFLAPLSVALLLLGEWVHLTLFKGTATLAPADDPFPQVPAVPALARTLAVCCVALLLNPTFLAGVVKQPAEAITQLVPFECNPMVKGLLGEDKDLVRITWSMGQRDYFDARNPYYGRNLNTAVAGGLALVALVLTVVGYRLGRASHLVLWIGLAVLPLLVHARFLAFFLIVTAILTACHLNALGRTASSLRATHHAARSMRSLATFGRILTLIALVVLLIVVVPGWLQPMFDTRALDRWVAWSVEPDEGMKRGAELVQSWHDDPTKAAALTGQRGMLSHPDFGDYATWYAPAEKTYLNSRFQLHRTELPDLVELRKWLIYAKVPIDVNDRPVNAVLRKNGASYLCAGQTYSDVPTQAIQYAITHFIPLDTQVASNDLIRAIWHLDGRFAVIGLADTPDGMRRSQVFDWNASRVAFGPRNQAAGGSEGDVIAALPVGDDWANDFVVRPPIPPVELSDSRIYSNFAMLRRQLLTDEAQRRTAEWQGKRMAIAVLLGATGPLVVQSNLIGPPPVEKSDIDFALPLLAVQAARKAGSRDPQSPESFTALALAYSLEVPELQPNENRIQLLTALTRAAARLPEPIEGVRTRYTPASLVVQMLLFRRHLMASQLQDQHLDLARTALVNLIKLVQGANEDEFRPGVVIDLWSDWYTTLWVELATYARQPVANRPTDEQLLDILVQQKFLDPNDDIRKWGPQGQSDLTREFALTRLDKLEKAMREGIRRRNDQIERMPPEMRFQQYIRIGLPGKAIEQIDIKNVPLDQVVTYVGLTYAIGRLEEGHVYRKQLEESVAQMSETDPRKAGTRGTLRNFELTEAKLSGNLKVAERLIEEEFKRVAPAKLTEAERGLLKSAAGGYVMGLGSLGGIGPLLTSNVTAESLRSRLFTESMFLYQRGVMALLDGDTKLAKAHFDAANKPQGIEWKEVGVPAGSIELSGYLPKYRELLDKYGAGK